MNKLQKAGFSDVRRGEELPFGIDEAASYPLFTPDLIALMRRVIPPERHGTVVRSVTYTAWKAAHAATHSARKSEASPIHDDREGG